MKALATAMRAMGQACEKAADSMFRFEMAWEGTDDNPERRPRVD